MFAFIKSVFHMFVTISSQFGFPEAPGPKMQISKSQRKQLPSGPTKLLGWGSAGSCSLPRLDLQFPLACLGIHLECVRGPWLLAWRRNASGPLEYARKAVSALGMRLGPLPPSFSLSLSLSLSLYIYIYITT